MEVPVMWNKIQLFHHAANKEEVTAHISNSPEYFPTTVIWAKGYFLEAVLVYSNSEEARRSWDFWGPELFDQSYILLELPKWY